VLCCINHYHISELPCPEPIVVEDPPLNPELVCMPPKEGIDTSNITTAATTELMNQTGLINNNNATEGDLVITEEGKPSEPCLVITEEGMPTKDRPQPQPQPSPSPKPC
jgi:hypothetical protein